jgi:hypothetical protein
VPQQCVLQRRLSKRPLWHGRAPRLFSGMQRTRPPSCPRERVSRVEVENIATLASTRGEVEGFTQRISLLEGELVEVRQAQETTEENYRACQMQRPMSSGGGRCPRGREFQEWLNKLTLLQTRGSSSNRWGSCPCQWLPGAFCYDADRRLLVVVGLLLLQARWRHRR